MKTIMGMEVHVQIKTNSKIFCGCSANYNVPPNTNVCDVCLGFPGTKPRFNRKVLENAIKVGLALNGKFHDNIFFSRKSYFYPDMSKNFQITQYEIPLVYEGLITINVADKEKKIRIRRIHIEEDPARLIHEGADITTSKSVLVDYNRSGIPLIEVVTEPDFESVEEVRAFFDKLRSILEHLDVFDSENYIMKSDANISMTGGERVEIKNITGAKAVEKALNFEILRQKNLLKRGLPVKRETRHFDALGGTTKSLRTKETEEDYGYIFEPDLVWYSISAELIKKIQNEMPELPDERIERFTKEYEMNHETAVALISDKKLADFFEQCAKKFKDKKLLANFTTTHLMKCLNFNKVRINRSKVTAENYLDLLENIKDGTITERLAKEKIKDLVGKGSVKLEKKVSDEELKSVIKKVLKKNAKAADDYKHNNESALNFLVGQVLKQTKFAADPNKVREFIRKQL